MNIDKQTWEKNKEKENEQDTHPCNHWLSTECMCKGFCSCHWVEEKKDETI